MPRVDRFLNRCFGKGYSTAKLCRTVLSGICRWLARRGGMPFNPVRDTAPLELDRDRTAKAMTPAQVREWLDLLDADDFARRHDLPELSRFILGTGLRLGEALGCDGTTSTRSVGPFVSSELWCASRVEDWSPRPKTRSSQRVLVLPGWCLTMLLERRARLGVADGPIFADSSVATRDRNNVGAAFRRVRTGTEYRWVTSHTFPQDGRDPSRQQRAPALG